MKRTLLEVLDVAARERDTDLVQLRRGDGRTRCVVFLFTLSDVTHPSLMSRTDRGDYGVDYLASRQAGRVRAQT